MNKYQALRLPAALCAASLLITASGAALAMQPSGAPAASPAPHSVPAASKAQASYSIGLLMGKPLHNANLRSGQISLPEITRGLHEALHGKEVDPAGEQAIDTYLGAVQKGSAATPAIKAQASHAIGLSMGQRLRDNHLSDESLSVAQLARGVNDSLGGKQPTEDQQRAMLGYLEKVQIALAEGNHAKARAFLAANAKKPGVVTTASGLQYKILSPGRGTPPKSTDTVTVHYTGRLLDGTEFDGTDLRGNQPASFQVSAVIQGWQEALSLMKPGARWTIYIPPELAYGTNSPPPIPPGSLLVFNVELLKVESGAATPH